MSDSTNLGLPYLAAAQAQKHVTVNEALRRLDALVQLSVVSATVTAQPASPADGAVYILPAGKTGTAWGAMANSALAYWRDGAWEQITPREGWLAYVKDTDQLLAYTGSAWSQSAARTALGTAGVGVANTWTAEQTNTAGYGWTYQIPNGGQGGARFRTAAQVKYELGYNDASGNFFLNLFSGGVYAQTPFLCTPSGMLQTNGAALWNANASNLPFADNVFSLGNGSFRFTQLFAASGTINTSDAREKTPLEPVPEAAKRAVRRVLAGAGVFQWLDAVAAKGADGARLHVGATAQAVRDAFEAEGLDPARWGLFCADPLFERVEVEPARIETREEIDPETGEALLVSMPIPARFEERPVLEPDGTQRVRLGLREGQLFWLALAALAA